MKTQKAFTLVELVITITVAGILLGLGVPAFKTMILNNRLTSHANEFVAAMNLARSEAIKRSADVKIGDPDCTDGTDEWEKGWTVWIDADDDCVVDADEVQLRVVGAFDDTTKLDSTSTPNIEAFTYEADGALNGGRQTLELCNKPGERGRQITIASTGRISMNSEYTCP